MENEMAYLYRDSTGYKIEIVSETLGEALTIAERLMRERNASSAQIEDKNLLVTHDLVSVAERNLLESAFANADGN